MRTEELNYNLPPELIAQDPAAVRSASRLLVLDRSGGPLIDSQFSRLRDFLRPGDGLVLNDTRVLPARFFARRKTGARLEGLFLSVEGDPGLWKVMLKGARKVRPGETFALVDKAQRQACLAVLVERRGEGVCLLKVDAEANPQTVLEAIGFPPLPPYIRRDDDPARAERDKERYQTVYARDPGAVAAPTAGLHFTEPLLAALEAAGIRLARVTLHVGAGTFKPVTAEHLDDHPIHREWFRIDAENAATINRLRDAGGRIIAVGTTVTRVLETVATDAGVTPGEGTTDLFIQPGYAFKAVDAMVTNFHLPKSTLLALVGAFAGLDKVRAAYEHAIAQRYRFYSYGDAMLIA